MTKEKPLVSIIIACYNAENYIDICMESLIKQTYKNFEIIVCDDASTDKSIEILKKWEKKDKRIIILKNKINMFAAATRNRCFKIAQGDYFMIQDIDDLSRLDRIEKLLEVLQKEDKIDFVSSSMLTFKNIPGDSSYIWSNRNEYPTKWSFMWNSPFFNPASMFTRKCIEDVKGYRVAPETKRGEDYDMFMRMYSCGYKGKNIFDSLYIFRLDDANIKRRTFSARIGEYKIRKYGFKRLGISLFAIPFLFKPFLAHIFQKIKYINGIK
ncbi:glycosyltransferase family 2 protein [Fusobacterium varium]